MLGIGEIFSISCAICWAVAIVLFKHCGESLTANTLNLLKNCIGLLLLIPTALFLEGVILPNLTLVQWSIVLASGYFGIAIADSWYFEALRRLGAGRTAIVASLYSPFVVIFSIIILQESLETWQWLGFVLVLLGILLVVYQRHYKEIDKRQLLSGVAYAASSVLLTALGVVLVKPILENPADSLSDNFFWIVTFRLLAGVVGTLFFLLLKNKFKLVIEEFKTGKHNWSGLIIASVFASYLAMILWLAGFKYTSASVASVLNETANIFIVLLAWLFLKEELSKRKITGISLAFAGVLVFIGVFNP
ncbi:MAG: DMT family transporter [Kangiellaceae bacterium]|nr:DMT family transporter [Kangiellaceae bacterium]